MNTKQPIKWLVVFTSVGLLVTGCSSSEQAASDSSGPQAKSTKQESKPIDTVLKQQMEMYQEIKEQEYEQYKQKRELEKKQLKQLQKERQQMLKQELDMQTKLRKNNNPWAKPEENTQSKNKPENN
ncbi:hypothetical protein [Paenibacillus sp. YYML68]|uniref:hypothetical protein n=1 Tax=Paenibacillus sp. YYML68 TaxID=2909250 RepID=UPI0024931937|nr:hypothetical protein [Paenibacillus sp. YYML68]